MIPAALLSGGLRVLDLCAAPGMKTTQLLDTFARSAGSDLQEVLGQGVVMANELDGRRCCMLAHHALRIRHPGTLVVHHNATAMPQCGGLFDRVLCDVPCSGDGTFRKAPQLWSSWRPNKACVLHNLQLRIATAGALLLSEAGRMVYSTCSMNPVENEAVVAALLQRAGGALRLAASDDLLPGLSRERGLRSWLVHAGAAKCRSATVLKTPAEAAERGLSIQSSAWPPAEDFNLEQCWRFYPHNLNSGGFFVALLERTGKPFPADFGVAEPSPTLEAEDLPEDAICKEELPATQREDQHHAVTSSEQAIERVTAACAFYGLEDLPLENLFMRGGGDGRNIYLVSNDAREVLRACPDIRAMVVGVRVFEDNRFLKSSVCQLRLAQEGIHWLAPSMKRRCVASPEDMSRVLSGGILMFSEFSEDSSLRIALEAIDAQGSVAITCDVAGGSLCVAAERGAESVTAFVNQHELAQLREALHEMMSLGPAPEHSAA